jgi:hypothetical protein
MPGWLIPALKAVLPHVGTIISTAAPVFSKKSAEAVSNQPTLLQQQINELQAAASANDVHIKELAAQIQKTVEVLEAGAALADRRHARMLLLCGAAAALSLIALCVALFALAAH